MTYEAVVDDNQVCTCLPIDGANHDFECELWQSPGWRAGLLAWDDEKKVMYAADEGYYVLTEEEVREYAEMIGGPDPFDDDEDESSRSSAFIVQANGEIVPIDEPDPDEDDDDLDEYLRKRFEGVDKAIDEATKKEPTTKEKADTAFDKLRKAARGVVDKMTAAHDSNKPSFPECTCQDKDDAIPLKFNHLTTCDIAKFKPWVNTDCEWDHNNRRFLWYAKDVIDKTKVDPWLTAPPAGVLERLANKETSGTKDKGKTTHGGNSAGYWDDWGGSTGYGFTGGGYQKCRHYEQDVVFPDGTKAIASSQFSRKKDESVPDDALYLASSWSPTSLATFLPWIDHGLPAIRWDHAVGIIIEKFERAKQGWTIEIGCIGGHGRTGSVLACMAILGGVPPDEACAWVWANYCEHAIESDDQIWWIEWFASRVSDWPEPLPPKQLYTSVEPKPKPPPKKDTAKKAKGLLEVDPDIPACRDCGTERTKGMSFVCNNSKCKPNYTLGSSGKAGETILEKWKAKFAKERKEKVATKAKTPPKAKVPAEHSGIPIDADNPICKGCGSPRHIQQVHICNNEKCRPNYQIPSDSPRGERILARWRNEEERKK